MKQYCKICTGSHPRAHSNFSCHQVPMDPILNITSEFGTFVHVRARNTNYWVNNRDGFGMGFTSEKKSQPHRKNNFSGGPFCTLFAPPKMKNRVTHGFQTKKLQKCRIKFFYFAHFSTKDGNIPLFLFVHSNFL